MPAKRGALRPRRGSSEPNPLGPVSTGRALIPGVVSPVAHPPPPYVVRTERLIIRCWQPADAVLLKDALDTSLDHLRPWMPWAAEEPKPLAGEGRAAANVPRPVRPRRGLRLRDLRRAEQVVIGGTGLHTRVGDRRPRDRVLDPRVRGRRGYARESAAALTTAAIRVCGVDRVEIHVDPANKRASASHSRSGSRRRRRSGGGCRRPEAAPRAMSSCSRCSRTSSTRAPAAATFDAYDASGADRALSHSPGAEQVVDDVAESRDEREMTLVLEEASAGGRDVRGRATRRARREPSRPAVPARRSTGTAMSSNEKPHGRVNARSSSCQPQIPFATAVRRERPASRRTRRSGPRGRRR